MGNEGLVIAPNQYQYYQSSLRNINTMRPLSIKLKKYDFFKGEYVEGYVVLQNTNSLVLNDIYLNLFQLETWRIEGDQSCSDIYNPLLLSVCIGIGKILKIDGQLINLNPGVFNFPFKFKLPDNIQSCFEYPKTNKRGLLRYILQAKIISQYVQGEGSVGLFIKSRPLKLNCPLSFSSAMNVHKWGMVDQGSTILKVSYQTTNYQFRSQLPFTVEINNTRGKAGIKNVDAKIVRRVQYYKSNNPNPLFCIEDVINNKIFQVNVPANTNSQTYNYMIEIIDNKINEFNYGGQYNPYPSLKDIFYAMPTTTGQIIKCDYFLVVSLNFSSFVTKGYIPKVCIPFSITHQLQNDYDLEKKEESELQKAIEASLLDAEKNKEKKEININEIDDKKENNLIEKPKDEPEENNKKEENNNIIEIKEDSANENNKNENKNDFNLINDDSNNNININEINNNNNINNIKNEDEDIINPYKEELNNNINEENKNNNSKTFSINDFDEDN